MTIQSTMAGILEKTEELKNLTGYEEDQIEVDTCDMCDGHGEINISGQPDEDKLVPCPECQSSYYDGDEGDNQE